MPADAIGLGLRQWPGDRQTPELDHPPVMHQTSPMSRAHQGFEGHLFGRRGGDCVVVTIWKDDAAADALEASPRYRETVARITAAGFLTGPSRVDRFRLHGDVVP